MSNSNNGMDRMTREALKRLEAKADRNSGGVLLGKRMVHKAKTAYNRQAFRAADRRGDY